MDVCYVLPGQPGGKGRQFIFRRSRRHGCSVSTTAEIGRSRSTSNVPTCRRGNQNIVLRRGPPSGRDPPAGERSMSLQALRWMPPACPLVTQSNLAVRRIVGHCLSQLLAQPRTFIRVDECSIKAGSQVPIQRTLTAVVSINGTRPTVQASRDGQHPRQSTTYVLLLIQPCAQS